MIYTVTFNPALDYVIHLNKLELGETNRCFGEELYFGGKIRPGRQKPTNAEFIARIAKVVRQ